jgi:diguanylate cyclase (GGDEF)-like protein
MTGSIEALPAILIVDDDTTNIAILAHVLENEFDVVFATDGVQALELALTVQPALVLLDVMMPGMDGYEVLSRLKSEPLTTEIPVIFLTGLDASEAETRGLELGASDYVTKPFNAAVVRARVRNQIELRATRDQLRRLAAIDGLIGIPNRRTFDETLEREYRRLSRTNGRLALIMVDVDEFKSYNDRYGHLAGDDCLRAVARAIASTTQRSNDLIARFGGEEFTVLLPDTDADGALRVAERMRAAVESLGYVTASFGVAAASSAERGDPASLVRAADDALYAAKAAGRNCVRAGSHEDMTFT